MLKILLYIVIGLLIFGGGMMTYFSQGLIKYRKMAIEEIDLSKIRDGIYQGEFTGGRWKNKLEVTVKDHEIKEIEMVESSSLSGMEEFGQKVFQEVKEKQSLKIDTISGATVHTKTVLKSIENALKQEE